MIAMGKLNEPQRIYNHLEKAENVFIFLIVVNHLYLIWFARSDQKKIAKNCQFLFSNIPRRVNKVGDSYQSKKLHVKCKNNIQIIFVT